MDNREIIQRLIQLKGDILDLDTQLDRMLEEMETDIELESEKKLIRRIVRDFIIDEGNGLEDFLEIGKEKSIKLYKELRKKFKYINGEKLTVYKALRYAEIDFEYMKGTNDDGWTIIRITMPEV